MKKLSWLLVLVVLMTVERSADSRSHDATSQGTFRNLVVAPAVSDNLALLFSQFETELVLCLEGERRGADLYITDFRMPHILLSEQGRVQAAGCKSSSRSIGTWHNHPPPAPVFANSSSELLARNCYLSRTDIADFQRRATAQVTVVSCAPGIYAYWKRSDIADVVPEIALLTPPEQQLVHHELPRDGRSSNLTQARKH